MASVIKCDICGDVYEQYPVKEIMQVQVMSNETGGRCNVFHCDEYDFCPKCTATILSLIDCMKEYPNRVAIEILNEAE